MVPQICSNIALGQNGSLEGGTEKYLVPQKHSNDVLGQNGFLEEGTEKNLVPQKISNHAVREINACHFSVHCLQCIVASGAPQTKPKSHRDSTPCDRPCACIFDVRPHSERELTLAIHLFLRLHGAMIYSSPQSRNRDWIVIGCGTP